LIISFEKIVIENLNLTETELNAITSFVNGTDASPLNELLNSRHLKKSERLSYAQGVFYLCCDLAKKELKNINPFAKLAGLYEHKRMEGTGLRMHNISEYDIYGDKNGEIERMRIEDIKMSMFPFGKFSINPVHVTFANCDFGEQFNNYAQKNPHLFWHTHFDGCTGIEEKTFTEINNFTRNCFDKHSSGGNHIKYVKRLLNDFHPGLMESWEEEERLKAKPTVGITLNDIVLSSNINAEFNKITKFDQIMPAVRNCIVYKNNYKKISDTDFDNIFGPQITQMNQAYEAGKNDAKSLFHDQKLKSYEIARSIMTRMRSFGGLASLEDIKDDILEYNMLKAPDSAKNILFGMPTTITVGKNFIDMIKECIKPKHGLSQPVTLDDFSEKIVLDMQRNPSVFSKLFLPGNINSKVILTDIGNLDIGLAKDALRSAMKLLGPELADNKSKSMRILKSSLNCSKHVKNELVSVGGVLAYIFFKERKMWGNPVNIEEKKSTLAQLQKDGLIHKNDVARLPGSEKLGYVAQAGKTQSRQFWKTVVEDTTVDPVPGPRKK